MENEINQLKTQLEELNKKTTLIYSALIGNELSPDGGIVHRLDTVEQSIDSLRTDFGKYRWILYGILITVPVYVSFLVFIFKQLNLIT